jgi:hypothetical protein
MRKYLIIALSFACFAATAQTAQSKLGTCPFTDNFSIVDMSHPNDAVIQALSSSGNIAVSLHSFTSFTTSCGNNASANDGNAYVTVANSTGGICYLTILDGPYEMNPSVTSVNCLGNLIYSGIGHQYASYSYQLNFINTLKK